MYFQTIDIAHPPMRSSEAEIILDESLRLVRNSDEVRALKIIHGQGTDERPSQLRNVARDWAFYRKKQVRAIIYGEHYDLFDRNTAAMRKECGSIQDNDLGASNAGITILWVK